MAEWTSNEVQGTIFRGPDGKVYYIQDEVLDSLRLPDELAQQAEKLASAGTEVQGFSMEVGAIDPIARVTGGVDIIQAGATPKSTLMCWSYRCWER
jgi:hypothetical protein